MIAITWIDAFRRVADCEIDPGLEPRFLFQNRNAIFLGGAWIDCGFIDDDVTGFSARPTVAEALQSGQVRPARVVNRRRNGDYEEVGGFEVRGVRREGECLVVEVAGVDFACRVVSGLQFAHPVAIDVEADHGRPRPAKSHGHGEPHIAQPDDCNFSQRYPRFKSGSPRNL